MVQKRKSVISVVIAAFNEEKLLPRCLKALKKQDFKKPYEIILVDNCSTDKTPSIGKKFGCKVVRESKKGQIFAKQKGCMKAKSKIIAVLDADNIPSTNWLSLIYNELRSKSNQISAVTGIYDYGESDPLWHKIHDKIFYMPLHFINEKLFNNTQVLGGNVAFYKKDFVSFGGYNLNNNSIAECEMGLAEKLKKFGNIKYKPKMTVQTSTRVIEKGFLFFFKKYTIEYSFGYTLNKFFKKSLFKDSQDIR